MKKAITMLILLCVAAFAQQKGTFTDARDGKKYKIVKIGEQVWMAQNLDYHGEDGYLGLCYGDVPKNKIRKPENCKKYGRLYSWNEAINACPAGWHLSSDGEWRTLVNFLGGSEAAGKKLKAKSGWNKCNYTEQTAEKIDNRGRILAPATVIKHNDCTDEYGFSALPGGHIRSATDTYSYVADGNAYWWTSARGGMATWSWYMGHNYSQVIRELHNIGLLFSVRCVQDSLATAEAAKKAEKIADAANPITTEVTGEVTILRGSTLAKKLAWLDRSTESHNTYIIEVNANENIAQHTFEYNGAINITVILRGDSENRTIRLKTHGNMFIVKQNVTFVLDNNITLHGHNGNNGNMVNVEGGTLKMNDGVTITGNTTYGGVYIEKGTFEMNGGIISGNGKNTDFFGGGVDNRGTFIMNGGTISGNTAVSGGGVYVSNNGTFTMSGGTISGNNSRWGGGVCIQVGTFEMTGGTISGNIATESGGGIHLSGYNYARNTFNMRGGIITANTARERGGGVDIDAPKTFTHIGGIITGYNSDRNDGNVVKDEEGVIARRGHAVRVEKWRKETTAESDDNLSCNNNDCTGAWDD